MESHPWPVVTVDYAQLYTVEISSKCSFECLDTYEQNIEYYKENDCSYIPLSTDLKYYDIESEKLKELDREQWIWLENAAIPEMEKLEDYDFLLVYDLNSTKDSRFSVNDEGVDAISYRAGQEDEIYQNPQDLLEDWPEYREEVFEILQDRDCVRIITLADLNDRRVRGVLYHLISSTEVILSDALEAVFPDGEQLIKNMAPVSVGRWKKAEFDAGQLHPVEYAYIGDLKHLAATSPDVVEMLG